MVHSINVSKEDGSEIYEIYRRISLVRFYLKVEKILLHEDNEKLIKLL